MATLSLLACSPAQGVDFGETKPLLLVTASGSVQSDCSFKVEETSVDLLKPTEDDLHALEAAEQILVAGTGDAAYQCVTMAVDRLNDLGIHADFEEKAWQNLASVKAGVEKLKTDLASDAGHPEAKPFDRTNDANADVDAALERAGKSGNDLIIIMGANWCHDSRGLSGWFASPRFSRMLSQKYEVVYVDVGYKDRNLDVAKGYGIGDIQGTPTVLVVSPEAQLLNPKSAPTWRNAASRDEDAIFDYFDQFTPEM